MSINDQSLVQYEGAQVAQGWEELTDTGDHKLFEAVSAPFSGASDVGLDANVKPYGLATGGKVTPGTANNTVDVAALSAYMVGATGADANTGLISVGASAGEAVTRAVTLTHLISSITVDSTGAVTVVAGTEGNSFVETRGGAGGPPFIPVGSIEIAQVRLSAQAAAPVLATEIFQNPGQHQERYDNPQWEVKYLDGAIEFLAALPLIHTGSVPKKVPVNYAVPTFTDLPRTTSFKPARNSHSTNSEDTHSGPVATKSSSLNGGSFSALLNDGHTDGVLGIVDKVRVVKFKQNKNLAPYSLTIGTIGIDQDFDPGKNPEAEFTITPIESTKDFAA